MNQNLIPDDPFINNNNEEEEEENNQVEDEEIDLSNKFKELDNQRDNLNQNSNYKK